MTWPRKREVLGVGVSETTYEEAVDLIIDAAKRGSGGLVELLSVHGLMEARKNDGFAEAIERFDVVAPDGQPVRWALNWLHGAGLRDRVRGSDLMVRLCERAANEGVGVYLYGGAPAVLPQLVGRLLEGFPGLRIVGADSPPFRALTREEDDATVRRINGSGAGLLFIGLGCPKQELFAAEHEDGIRAVQLCVGAAFDFLAGAKSPAPLWMQRAGLEWLFRLATEPRRLWRRYLVANSMFIFHLGLALAVRLRGSSAEDAAHVGPKERAGEAK